MDEGYRTTRSSVDSMESDDLSEEKVSDKAVVVASEKVIDNTEKHIARLDTMNEYRTEETQQVVEVDSFLDSDKSYQLPNFNHSVQNNVIFYTLEVKNVSEESIEVRVTPEKLAVQLKFSSVGAGQFPIHYAFYVEVKEGIQVEQDQVNIYVFVVG